MEKELLAVVFGLTRFHQYTFGRQVLVINDHKPLEAILKKPLYKAPRRLQNLMLQVLQYDAVFKYEKGETLHIADFLSRAPLRASVHDIKGEEMMDVEDEVMKKFPDTLIEEVRRQTEADPVMSSLMECIRHGWPPKKDLPSALLPYWSFRDLLSSSGSLILKDEQILIPPVMRPRIKNKLHSAHMGVDSMLRRAKQAVFWPGIRHEVKQMAEACEACARHKPSNQKEPLKPQPDGDGPWMKVGVDLCELYGRTYLITVDFYSSFVEVDVMTSTSSAEVIKKLKAHCARYGVFKEIVSDQGPQFTSALFKKWTKDWHIVHTMSSPYHHQANGRAEAAVKLVKNMLKKTFHSNGDQYEALLELRNTPRQDTGMSPAQLLFGRKTRALVPVLKYHEETISKEEVRKRRTKRKAQMKTTYDRAARGLPDLSPSQAVWYQKDGSGQWYPATVQSKIKDRSFVIETDGHGRYRRNRVHLRERTCGKDSTAGAPENGTADTPEGAAGASRRAVGLEAQSPDMHRGARQRRQPAWMNDYVCTPFA